MKRTRLIELLATIKGTFVSFFSILMFVALGIGIFAGIRWSVQRLNQGIDMRFQETDFHDLEVTFPYGMSDADLDKIRDIKEVSYVEPAYVAYGEYLFEETGHVVAIMSISDTIDRPVVVEGELPTRPDEIAISRTYAAELGLKPGDTFELMPNEGNPLINRYAEILADTAEPAADGAAATEPAADTTEPSPAATEGDNTAATEPAADTAEGDNIAAAESAADGAADAEPAADTAEPAAAAATDTNATDSDFYYLKNSRFTITALVESPAYISTVRGTLGVSQEGKNVEFFAYVTPETFNPDAYLDLYPSARVRVSTLEGLSTFSDEYHAESNRMKAKIEELGEPLSKARYNEIYSTIQNELDKAKAQLDEGEEQLAQAADQVQDGELQIEKGKVQLEAAIAQLEAGEQSYETTKAQGEAMLANMRASLDKLQAAYDEAMAALDENSARVDEIRQQTQDVAAEIDSYRTQLEEHITRFEELDKQFAGGFITQEEYEEQRATISELINALTQLFKTTMETRFPWIIELLPIIEQIPEVDLNDPANWIAQTRATMSRIEAYEAGANEMLDQANADFNALKDRVASLSEQLDQGWAQYRQAEERLNSALAQAQSRLNEGRTQVDEGRTTIDEQAAQLEEGKQLIQEKTAELEEGKSAYEQAVQQASKLSAIGWIVTDRYSTGGVIAMSSVTQLTEKMRVTMSSMFFVVGMLVCFSAISRIVHEQVRLVGTKKAVGFRDGEVTAGYMAYTALAVVAGMLASFHVGAFAVQTILYDSLTQNLDSPVPPPYIDVTDVLLVGAAEMALLLGITWFACRSVLKRQATELLQGETTSYGRTHFYERWGIWKKLPLFTQTMINNCVNDPRRVFATIVGVAGCTALIVVAMTLNGNLVYSMRTHYETVGLYNASISIDPNKPEAFTRISQICDEHGFTHATIRKEMFLLEDEHDPQYENVYIPLDRESFSKLFVLEAVPATGEPPLSGVWVAQSFMDHRNGKVGGTVKISTVAGERYEPVIEGFYTYYIPYNTMVVDKAYYEQTWGKELVPNMILVDSKDVSADEVGDMLRDVDGFMSITDERAVGANVEQLITRVTAAVVAVFIALSAVMALVVLLNLNIMFVNEKKRELIVLMVNGFTVRDAKAYIYRDAIIMTILGILVGLGVGVFMGSRAVVAVEWATCSFYKGPNLQAIAAGAGMSAVFSAIVMAIALRRIPRFSLTDISK